MESQQVDVQDPHPMLPKMVQHGDQIRWSKYPWESSQSETTGSFESKDVMQVAAEGAKHQSHIFQSGLSRIKQSSADIS